MNEWAIDQYFSGAITDDATGERLEYRDLINNPADNELGRLSQGTIDIRGTDTIFFILL